MLVPSNCFKILHSKIIFPKFHNSSSGFLGYLPTSSGDSQQFLLIFSDYAQFARFIFESARQNSEDFKISLLLFFRQNQHTVQKAL